jgi:hypothetical protein
MNSSAGMQLSKKDIKGLTSKGGFMNNTIDESGFDIS